MKKKNTSKKETIRRRGKLVTDSHMPLAYVEAYKSLRTNVKFVAASEEMGKCFVITSASPMESKSNVSANLAITLAAEGSKVLLIEGDMRKPSLNTLLRIKGDEKGMSSVLTGKISAQDAMLHLVRENFDILSCGIIPPNPAELLSSDRMRKLITNMKKIYDYVIIDAPPVSVVTDAAVVGSMADGAILVVRSNFSSLENIQQAKQNLEDARVKILGVVLTRVNAKKSSRYGYYKDYGYAYSANTDSKKRKRR